MNHVDAVLDGDLDNLVDSKVRLDWCILSALSNGIGLVGLCRDGQYGVMTRVVW